MLNKFKFKIKNKNEIIALTFLLITTIGFTTYYNFSQQRIQNNVSDTINNIYFKKTINHFLDKLEPKFKKIRHKITEGETFDSILDQYTLCEPIGMSAEAPVIVVRELDTEEFIGGAGIVAAHATALGAECHYLSVVGDDDNAHWVQRDLDRLGVKHHLIGDPSRPTTFKIRYMVEKQKVFRVSRLKEHSLDTTTERALIAKFDQLVEMVDAVLVSDFVYGVITSGFLEHIRRACIERNLMLFGDVQCSSQVGSVTKFRGFDLICPTEREARISLGDSDNGIEWLAQELIQSTKCENLVIKLGSEGFIGYASDKDGTLRREHFPALVSNPVDVAGAGDSLLAAMAVAMSSGANLMEAAAVAANMAAISVSQLGNRPIKASQIKERMVKGYQLA